jgi:hypothetical protein
MEASTEISKEDLGGQAMCDSVRIPAGSLQEDNVEAVRVKSKLQRRPQDVGDARNGKGLPRKTTGNEWSHLGKGNVDCQQQGHRREATQAQWSSHQVMCT